MVHALITAVWCLACILLGLPWPFFFWAPAWYCGREVAQAEHRYIEAHGGHRADCPWFCGFLPEAWTAKGLLDFLLPLAVALTFTLFSLCPRPRAQGGIMSTPTILDYPGARYLYNVQAGQDAEEYASKDAFTGATADDDGTAGLVPAPEASADVMLLCSDGTWKTLADLGITVS